MTRNNRNIQGSLAMTSELSPRTRRGQLGQVDDIAKHSRFRAIVATGGTITQVVSGGRTWNVHTFTGGGTFTISELGTETTLDYLVQAGGGGGGGAVGGGGGAGGQLQSGEPSAPVFTPSVSSFTITIGGGGGQGGNGGNSSIGSTVVCTGGGAARQNDNGANGGCGGGAQYNYNISGTGIAGPPRQGYDGGWGGGGTGVAATKSNNNGGNGRTTTIRGTTETFGGGGGGSGVSTGVSGTSGGAGGGGNKDAAGGTNTGGGGGASSINDGKPGGSGIVIIRYPITV